MVGDAEGAGVEGDAFQRLDRVPHADLPLRQDLGTQPASVHEAAEDAAPRQALEMGAGFAEAHAAQADVAHPELPPDEVVQGDPSCYDVSPRVTRGDLHLVVAGHGFDRLELDERDLAARARPVRVRARGAEVAVSLEAPPRDRADRPDGAHRAFRVRGDVDRDDLAGRAAHGPASGITASTSISTNSSGATSRPTWTSVVAGRMSRKNSACALPTRSQSSMFVRKIRVRTTCSSRAPAFSRAASILRRTCTAWRYASPGATTRPSGSVAVVPETTTHGPTRTAREYPTIGSHFAPEAILRRSMMPGRWSARGIRPVPIARRPRAALSETASSPSPPEGRGSSPAPPPRPRRPSSWPPTFRGPAIDAPRTSARSGGG